MGRSSARDGSVKYKVDDAVAEGVAVDTDGNIHVGETSPGTTLTGRRPHRLQARQSKIAPAMVMILRIGHRRYVLGYGVNTIGRDPDSTVWLNDSSVSRAHARLTIKDAQARVEDLQSKNGTSVQNLPIAGPTVLADGDEVEFGHVKGWFIIETTDDPPTTTHL